MKNLRMLLAATLALTGANAIWAQNPPPVVAPTDPPPIVVVQPTYAPSVAIGDAGTSDVPKTWFDLGWAFYWISPSPTTPLLTTSDPLDAGILGNPTTVTLVGGEKVSYGTINGITYSSGAWFDRDRTVGLEGSNVWSEVRVRQQFFASDGTLPLFRPFIDAATLAPTSAQVAAPLLQAGTFMSQSRLQFATGDTNLMFNLYRDEEHSLIGLLGYRYFYMSERLINTQENFYLDDNAGFFLGAPLLAGDSLRIIDRIEAVNRGLTGQVGLRYERNVGRLTLGVQSKLGFGWQQERVFFDGRTMLLPDGTPVAGGLLVQQSQPYRNQNEEFLFNPEVGVRGSFRVWRRFRVSFSYDFMYFSRVARPGAYIDPVIEQTQVPTSPTFTGVVGTRPKFLDVNTDMILHGVTVGVTWAY
jgi:hypothetical protein